MAGVYGVVEMKKSVVDIAVVMNVISKVIHKAGIFALVGLVGPIKDLAALNFEQLKKEISELDAAERKEVEDAFKGALALEAPDAQAKISGMVDCLGQAVDLVGQGLALYGQGLGLFLKVKLLLGV